MRRYLYLIVLLILPFVFLSCGSSRELQLLPKVYGTYNLYDYTVQNMDQTGKTNVSHLTVQYDGFDVVYQLNESLQMSFFVENKTNKSLIIDKSKSYVLIDGYSKELFKDVRSNRNTTFNNVQDAINNVQTNEGGQILTIPPYSRWQLPLEETNVSVMDFPEFIWQQGRHDFTQYTTNRTVEFVMPYTFDYSLAKWDTSRNRLFVGTVNVEKRLTAYTPSIKSGWDGKVYYHLGFNPDDMREYNAVKAYNDEITSRRIRKSDRKQAVGVVFGTIGAVAALMGSILALTLPD